MYESQFLLKRRPFAAIPDPRCFLAAESIQAALDELVVCVEQGQGVSVVSAPAGVGKTLLCERLGLELRDRFEVVLLRHASFLTRKALLQTILAELDHVYRRHDEQELRLELIPAIQGLKPAREALLLICDEAHMLSEDLLEELRILADLAEHGSPLVRLVLVGQSGLEETLAKPGLEALNQRIRAHICLDAFDRAATIDYIDYRITWAGGRTDEVFAPDALELIYQASQGVPRCINQLCDHALLLAYVAEEKPVSADTIREALQDLRQLPLHWNEGLLTADTSERDDTSFELMLENQRTVPLLGRSGTSSPISAEALPGHNDVQSFEFGADLPVESISRNSIPADSFVVETAEDQPWDSDESSVEFGAEDESSSPAADQPNGMQAFMMSESPRVECREYLEPPQDVRLETVEEVVWDRYAAIDGGFPLPTLAEIESTTHDKLSQWNVPAPLKDVSDTERAPQVQAAAASTMAANPIDDGFDEVCSRLDEMLPEPVKNVAWDSDALRFGPGSPDAAASGGDEWDSLETELGMAVCELTNEIQTEIRTTSEHNPAADKLHELLVEEPAGSEAEAVPSVISTRPQSNDVPIRSYRNLFSQLRRKQQGLL